MKVFIVDDSAEGRERLVAMLSAIKGIEIIGQAEDALEAIIRIRDCKPDALILDIRMAGMSGIDVLERVKKNGMVLW